MAGLPTPRVLLGHELINEHADAHKMHALRHDEEVVMVLNHQPQQEEQLRAPMPGQLQDSPASRCWAFEASSLDPVRLH